MLSLAGLAAMALRAQASETNAFGGIGARIDRIADAVVIVEVVPGLGAAEAGLAPGDTLVEIDDKPVGQRPIDELVAQIRGQPGTTVALEILPADGSDPRAVPVRRGRIASAR